EAAARIRIVIALGELCIPLFLENAVQFVAGKAVPVSFGDLYDVVGCRADLFLKHFICVSAFHELLGLGFGHANLPPERIGTPSCAGMLSRKRLEYQMLR